ALRSDLRAVRLPDRETESRALRERLEGILRRQLFVDVVADPRLLVQMHVAPLHLRAAGEDLLNHVAPPEIDVLLDAEVRDREIDVPLRRVVHRIDVARPVPSGADPERLSEARDLQARRDAADVIEADADEVDLLVGD